MKQFSINTLERLTGIKAHTIRIWEKRHQLFDPVRTQTNIRVYSLGDLRKLLNISLLVKNGARISALVRLDESEILKQLQGLKEELQMELAINQLLLSMYTSDVETMEDTLNSYVQCWGIDVTISSVIIPFMKKVELLCYYNNSAEVHFAVTAIRQKLILGIETTGHPQSTSCSAILFLPKGEHFDLILLYMAYLLKKNGVKVLYLGTNVSEPSLVKVALDKKPDLFYTYKFPRQKMNRQFFMPEELAGQLEAQYYVVSSDEDSKTEGTNLLALEDFETAVTAVEHAIAS
jgi:MerR family transcriptional regulator, light-induced transcriptional regulator